MNVLNIKDVVDGVRGIADDLITTDKERAELDIKDRAMDVDSQNKQIEVNMEQVKSEDNFTRRARPFILWICGCTLLYAGLIEPLLRFIASLCGYTGQYPVINTEITLQVLYAVLGISAMRSWDKKNK